jgi:tetratricopeptide (TPR) repeat protein
MARSNRYDDTSWQVPPDFVSTLKEAVRLTPRLPEAYFQLSRVFGGNKAYGDEIQALRHAVQLSPQDERYRYNLARAYKQAGNNDAFLKELSIFQQLHSRSSTAKP